MNSFFQFINRDESLRIWAVEHATKLVNGTLLAPPIEKIPELAEQLIEYVKTGKLISEKEKKYTYFFAYDENCQWYMIPIHLQKRWYELISVDAQEAEEKEIADNAINTEFSQYRTNGGISHIEFTPVNY